MKYTAKRNGVVTRTFDAPHEDAAIRMYLEMESKGTELVAGKDAPHLSLHDERDRMILTNNSFLADFVNQMTGDEWKTLQAIERDVSETPSVYIDIDGTLAKWNPNATMEEIFDPQNHYFAKVEPEQFVIDLAYQLYLDGVDVCIISAADKDTIPDKYEWLKKNLPFIEDDNIFFAPLGADKTQFIKGNADISVLIDDYNPNLRAWKEAGGHAIKMLNGINSSHSGFSEISFERLKERQATLREAEKKSDEEIWERVCEKAKASFASSAVRAIGMVAEEIEKTIGFDSDAERQHQMDDKE